MTFDTTFKTNHYRMIFAGFCDVNHHRRTLFFEPTSIINVTKYLFLWLFDVVKDVGSVHKEEQWEDINNYYAGNLLEHYRKLLGKDSNFFYADKIDVKGILRIYFGKS